MAGGFAGADGQRGGGDPVPGGNDNAYIYVNNPTDQYDLDGKCWRRWCHRASRWGWGTVSFFSAKGYVNGTWDLMNHHYHSAWNNFLGVAPTATGSAGLMYGGRPGVHRNTFSGAFKRFARGSFGELAGRFLGLPITAAATGLDYAHSYWNRPRHTQNINGWHNARGQVF